MQNAIDSQKNGQARFGLGPALQCIPRTWQDWRTTAVKKYNRKGGQVTHESVRRHGQRGACGHGKKHSRPVPTQVGAMSSPQGRHEAGLAFVREEATIRNGEQTWCRVVIADEDMRAIRWEEKKDVVIMNPRRSCWVAVSRIAWFAARVLGVPFGQRAAC